MRNPAFFFWAGIGFSVMGAFWWVMSRALINPNNPAAPYYASGLKLAGPLFGLFALIRGSGSCGPAREGWAETAEVEHSQGDKRFC
jgi:hypothetical protein